MRAVRTGRPVLTHTCSCLSCVALESWFQRLAWDSDGGEGRALSGILSLGTAPTSAPQNLHAIRTDSGLILEWEEVIPEGPLEGPLGPYKLSWVQDNGTQVRGDKSQLSKGTRVSFQGSRPSELPNGCPWWAPGLWWAGLPSIPESALFPTFPCRLPSLLDCLLLELHPVVTISFVKQEAHS